MFSCFNQDQPIDRVDFGGLAARLAQNYGAGKADGEVDRADACGTHRSSRRVRIARVICEREKRKAGVCRPFDLMQWAVDLLLDLHADELSLVGPAVVVGVTTITPSVGVHAHSAELTWITLLVSVVPGATDAKPPVLMALFQTLNLARPGTTLGPTDWLRSKPTALYVSRGSRSC